MIHRLITRYVPYITAAALALTGVQAFGAIATITPSQDTTVAQDFPDNSSGACDSVFAGQLRTTVLTARRALLQFDIAGDLPAGATINSVTLSMTITRGGNNADSTMTLHPINAAWVEGPEGCGVRGGGQGEPTAGGVTWNTQPGFGAASGSAQIVGADPVVWTSTATMVSDVRAGSTIRARTTAGW